MDLNLCSVTMTCVAIVYVSPSLIYHGNVFTEGKIPFLSQCHDEKESSVLANIACVLIGIKFLPSCFITSEFFLISQIGTAYWHSLWQVSRAIHTYANINSHPLPLSQMNYWSLKTQFKKSPEGSLPDLWVRRSYACFFCISIRIFFSLCNCTHHTRP